MQFVFNINIIRFGIFRLYSFLFTARKPTNVIENDYSATSPLLFSQDRDEDLPENKYKRRPAVEWLSRWFRFAKSDMIFFYYVRFNLLLEGS